MIVIGTTTGFTDSELWKLQQAVAMANAIMETDRFKTKIESTRFSATGYSSVLIYHSLVAPTWTVNFQIETLPFFKRLFTKEIAREVTGVGIIFNRDKFKKQSIASLAGTAAHEVSHTAGYSHPFWRSELRDESVPYQVGNIVEGIALGVGDL